MRNLFLIAALSAACSSNQPKPPACTCGPTCPTPTASTSWPIPASMIPVRR